jgi:hypothetical protein
MMQLMRVLPIRMILPAALLAASAIATSASAQAAPPTPPAPKAPMHEMHHGASSGWAELDAFHTLMAATWHPVTGSNDFKPIREKAGALADAATAWSASKVPAACDTKPVRDAVALLRTDSRAIADLVAKQAADSTVKRALSALHDRFETVEEGCKPAKK